MGIIISTKCVNDLKCLFKTNNLNHKDPFNVTLSAVHMIKRRNDKSSHITPLYTLQMFVFKNELHLLFISRFVFISKCYIDELGIFLANQTYICLDPRQRLAL